MIRPTTFHFPTEWLQKIQASAERHQRSETQEIIERVNRTFVEDDTPSVWYPIPAMVVHRRGDPLSLRIIMDVYIENGRVMLDLLNHQDGGMPSFDEDGCIESFPAEDYTPVGIPR